MSFHVGIICEGSTDYEVLKAVAQKVTRADVFTMLQPDLGVLAKRDDTAYASGWTGVKAFLEENAVALDLPVFDAVIIQVDASIRHLPEVSRKLRGRAPADDQLEPLRKHVASWAGGTLPERALLTLPREELEAWIVAAHTRTRQPEDVPDPAKHLVEKGILKLREGKPEKLADDYIRLSKSVVALATDHRRVKNVPELERAVDAMSRRARAVRASRAR